MTDARLEDLLGDLTEAVSDSVYAAERGGGFHRHDREIADARAALVAHVEAREVELMALALQASGYGWPTAVHQWREAPESVRNNYLHAARALRDALDRRET